MSVLLNAISHGFRASSILNVLKRAVPKYTDAIRTAEAAGYTAKSILRHLDGNKHDEGKYLTEREQQINQDKQKDRKAALGLVSALGVAGAVAGGIGSYLNRQTPIPGAAGNAPIPPPIVPGASQSRPSGPTLTAAQQQIVDKVPESFSPEEEKLMKNFKGVEFEPEKQKKEEFPQLQQFIDKSIGAGKTPEETYDNLKKSRLLSPLVHRIENQSGKSLLDDIKGSQPKETHSVGSETITPFGAGDIHKIHGDNAYVKVGDKLHKVPVEELEEPSESAFEAVQKILKIPEEDRSSNVSLFLWDPEDKTMHIQFHSGDTYKYLDVDPNVIKDLADKNGVPITEGKNMYGEWSQEDRKSLGAAFYQMILKDPKYKKNVKGQEANPYYKKLDTLYDYWKKLRNPPKSRR